jgi:hypothetical protein
MNFHAAVRRRALVALAGAGLMLGLSACDQIPSMAPADQAANKQACESIASTWNSMSSSLGSGNLLQLPATLAAVPTQIDAVLGVAKDKQLTEALTSLKTQALSVVAGAKPDVAGIVSAGVGLSARCTILGASVDIKIPQLG